MRRGVGRESTKKDRGRDGVSCPRSGSGVGTAHCPRRNLLCVGARSAHDITTLDQLMMSCAEGTCARDRATMAGQSTATARQGIVTRGVITPYCHARLGSRGIYQEFAHRPCPHHRVVVSGPRVRRVVVPRQWWRAPSTRYGISALFVKWLHLWLTYPQRGSLPPVWSGPARSPASTAGGQPQVRLHGHGRDEGARALTSVSMR